MKNRIIVMGAQDAFRSDPISQEGRDMEEAITSGAGNVERPVHVRAWRPLLICGILSSLLYVVINVLGAMRWEGYSFLSQTVSELSAIDAPSRSVVIPLGIAYQALVIAFGVGVWASARRNRALRITGGLLFAYGLLGFAAPFTPMHLRGEPGSVTDALHIILTTVTVLLIMTSVGFGAVAFGRRFRIYSIATILVVLGFGALAGLQGPRIAAAQPTPWMGLLERICIFGFLLWVAVLAIGLLRASDHHARDRPPAVR